MTARRWRAFLCAPVLCALGAVGAHARDRGDMAPFSWRVARVTTAMVRFTWHPGCPVSPASLRVVSLAYVGFDHQRHLGEIVVNAAVVREVVTVFHRLYAKRFAIFSLKPEEAFGGSDARSMAADNSSGFNCRRAVAPGAPTWSAHAYGEAIDINPVQNPYLEGGTVQPAAGRAYLDRGRARPGMALAGGTLVRAFTSVGWSWGGRWSTTPDYQHFSLTGN